MTVPVDAALTVIHERPGLTHIEIGVRLGSPRLFVGQALIALTDWGLVEALPTRRGSRCALRYYPVKESA